MESLGLPQKDAQSRNKWRRRIKGQLANPGSPGKMAVKTGSVVMEVVGHVLGFLGRLPKVDLIILEGEKCPYVRPSTKSFFDLNEIWYIGRGR